MMKNRRKTGVTGLLGPLKEYYFVKKGVENMKRITMRTIGAMLLVTLLAMAILPAFAQGREGAYVVRTEERRDRLNVHSTPGPGNVIGHLDKGTVVAYQYSDDGWWYVRWWKGNNNFGAGYVDGKYLVAIDRAKGAKFTCVDNLYVHSQCDIAQGECAKYHTDQLNAGKKVKVLKQDGTWAYVEYDGKTGWVSSVYLIESK